MCLFRFSSFFCHLMWQFSLISQNSFLSYSDKDTPSVLQLMTSINIWAKSPRCFLYTVFACFSPIKDLLNNYCFKSCTSRVFHEIINRSLLYKCPFLPYLLKITFKGTSYNLIPHVLHTKICRTVSANSAMKTQLLLRMKTNCYKSKHAVHAPARAWTPEG